MNPFDIVKDSSIWYNPQSFSATRQLDSMLHTGTVRAALNEAGTGELRYIVEVHYRGDTIPITCRMVRRFGGAFNYEDIVMRGYDYNTPAGIAAKAGDVVLVGLIGGQSREGVIIGGLTHPTRQNLKKDNGPEYKSEFNGVETYINKDGEYSLTFKAQPTNLSALDSNPNGPVPTPKYDTNIGSSYLKWDKTGSFTISDSAKSGPQSFFLDKKNGTIEIKSGTVSLKMDKNAQSIVLTAPDIKLGSAAAIQQAVHGTAYRANETIMNTVSAASMTAMGTALALASTQILNAAADPVLAGLAPKAVVALGAAATAIAAAGVAATAMGTAITAFESTAPLYLSNIVKVG